VSSKLPPVLVPHPHVFVDPAIADGSPCVRGSRVPVRRLFSWHRQGTTVETLLKRYPQLGPARVFDALSFAYDNLELVSADLQREREALAGAEPEPAPEPTKGSTARAQTALPFSGDDQPGTQKKKST
jgi:uncharacterized protein (DUF433 family)